MGAGFCVLLARSGVVGQVPGPRETTPASIQLPVKMKWKINLKHWDGQFHVLTWLEYGAQLFGETQSRCCCGSIL